MEAEGILRRVHGGAESLHNLQREESVSEKSIKNLQEKERIGRYAAHLVNDGDVIFLDAGTSTSFVIPYLHSKDITVVTNSIRHAAELMNRHIHTIIIGGQIKDSTEAVVGEMAMEQLSAMNFNKAFIGMNGVDKGYFTTPDMAEAHIKRLVIENASESFVLVDHSKFEHVSFARVAPVSHAFIVTDKISGNLQKDIEKQTEVVVV